MKHTTLIFFLILLSGCSTKEKSATSLEHAISSAIITKSISFSSTNIPAPNNPKIGDVCPQCNNPPGKCGVGKVGDGVICDTCLQCGGDGIIDEKDLNQVYEIKCREDECKCEVCECENCTLKHQTQTSTESENSITMYSSDGCVWCVKWEKEVKPLVEKMGIKVKKVDVTSGSVPRFDLNFSGGKIKYTGYITLETIKKHL